jgi:hypothetical protein
MNEFATLQSVIINNDGSVTVTWNDQTGSSFEDVASMTEEVTKRLTAATGNLQWLLLANWLNAAEAPSQCRLDMTAANGNWVQKL